MAFNKLLFNGKTAVMEITNPNTLNNFILPLFYAMRSSFMTSKIIDFDRFIIVVIGRYLK